MALKRAKVTTSSRTGIYRATERHTVLRAPLSPTLPNDDHAGIELTPCGRVPELAVADDLLHIGREVRIERLRLAGLFLVCFRRRDARRDRAAGWSGCADDGERLRVAF